MFRYEPEHEKKKKKNTSTHNEDSDQPDNPSCLNRILDSSYVVIIGSQGPKTFPREQ